MDIQNASTWQILIVDDEPDNLEVVAESLQFFGASVKIANNGEEGLKRLEEYAPSFILLDLSMPVMDGWEMRSRVKANPKTKHIPVIALSAHAMAGDKERAINAGFDGYMTKPINIPTLLTDLREVFQNMKPSTQEVPSAEVTATEASVEEAPTAEATTLESSSEVVSTEAATSNAASALNTVTSPATNGNVSPDTTSADTASTDTITNNDANISAEAGRATP